MKDLDLRDLDAFVAVARTRNFRRAALEQQVSLASALSALNKLRERLIELTPENLLLLTDEEMRACYLSRQKTIYLRHLAQALTSGQLNLADLEDMEDAEIRAKLTALKGIGHWTTDIYLMFCLQAKDIFPIGDIAVVNTVKEFTDARQKLMLSMLPATLVKA